MALRATAAIVFILVGLGCIVVAGAYDWHIVLAVVGLAMVLVGATQIDVDPPKKPEAVTGEVAEEEEAVGFRTRSGGR